MQTVLQPCTYIQYRAADFDSFMSKVSAVAGQWTFARSLFDSKLTAIIPAA